MSKTLVSFFTGTVLLLPFLLIGQEIDIVIPQKAKIEEAREYFRSDQFGMALSTADIAEQMALADNDLKRVVSARVLKVKVLEENLRFEEALRLNLETKELYCNANASEEVCFPCASIHYNLASYHRDLKNYSECLRYLNWISDHCIETKAMGYYFYNRAQILLLQDKVNEAMATMDEGIEVVKSFKDTFILIGIYNQKGIVAKNALLFREAITSFEKANELVQISGIRPSLEPVLMGNIGSCYLENGDMELAYKYLQADAKGSLKVKEYGSYINATLALVELDYKEGRLENAEKLLLDLKRDYSHLFIPRQWINYYNWLGKVASEQQEFELAYQCVVNEKNIIDSIAEMRAYQESLIMTDYKDKVYQQTTKQYNDTKKKPSALENETAGGTVSLLVYLLTTGSLVILLVLSFLFLRKKRKA